MNIDARQKRILKALIEEYVLTAEPVGSKIIAERLRNEMSSATIRNDLADLEALGLIDKPHTSAGRVPSTLGYRFYVDELMQEHRLTNDERLILNDALNLQIKQLDRLAQDTNNILSSLMKYAAFMVCPTMVSISIHRLEIIKIDEHNYVLLIVADTGLVKNKLVRINHSIDGRTYHTLLVLLNDSVRGVPLGEISDVRSFYEAPAGANELLDEIYRFIAEIYAEINEREVFWDGVPNLLKHPEFRDIEQAGGVIDYLTDRQKSREIARLAAARGESGLTISIGSENGEDLKNLSLLMTPYRMPGSGGGFIGLVGPTRMDYARVSARLRYFTEGLSNLLRQAFVDDDTNME